MQFERTEQMGEELMTDLQFLEYKRVRDELEMLRRTSVTNATASLRMASWYPESRWSLTASGITSIPTAPLPKIFKIDGREINENSVRKTK